MNIQIQDLLGISSGNKQPTVCQFKLGKTFRQHLTSLPIVSLMNNSKCTEYLHSANLGYFQLRLLLIFPSKNKPADMLHLYVPLSQGKASSVTRRRYEFHFRNTISSIKRKTCFFFNNIWRNYESSFHLFIISDFCSYAMKSGTALLNVLKRV